MKSITLCLDFAWKGNKIKKLLETTLALIVNRKSRTLFLPPSSCMTQSYSAAAKKTVFGSVQVTEDAAALSITKSRGKK